MEDTGPEVVTISDLLRRSVPLSAAVSLRSSSSRRSSSTSNCRHEHTIQNPKSKILTPLKHPVVLIGIVSLPVHDDASSTHKCPNKNACFRFSDVTGSVCCDLLDFGFPVLEKKIRVLGFNFVPFKHGGGFLEIIKWSLQRTDGVLLHLCSAKSSFPLVSGTSASARDGSKSVSSICGTVESVGPVCLVPCSTDPIVGKPINVRGFLVEFLMCECKLCKSKGPAEIALENHGGHVYAKPVFVYFCGDASYCHPAITKLIGKVIMLTGLKKKLVYIEKENSQVMYVITDKSLLHLLKMPKNWSQHVKVGNKGAKFGSYTGLVRSIYMQGMVVELDKEVWLVATDQQLLFPHSLRAGAVISVKNVHFVKTKLSGKKLLILGCCFKTSILVQSFSPFETRCHIKSEMQGLLCNFIASLAFSARLWVLLMVSCFRRKFEGILSEKDILGSKRKEGLLQIYASSYLPSWTYCSRHGAFMEICQHASSACGSERDIGDLKLAVPLSLFIRHCEAIWPRMQRRAETVCQQSHGNNKNTCFSSEGACYCQTLRRIIPSEDVGIILFGNIKISPTSGRIQLVDVTGSIDARIPDLPSAWNDNSLYEVSEYSLVIEGIPHQARNFRHHLDEPLSCSSIFNCTKLVRETGVHLFICFNSRSATCRRVPFDSLKDPKDENEGLGGRLHMLRVVHKFPSVKRFSDELKTSEAQSMFVEAVVLPWDLFLVDLQNEPVGQCASNWRHVSCHHKRQKTEERSWTHGSRSLNDGGCSDSERSCLTDSCNDDDIDRFGEFATHKVPCLATFRSSSNSFSGKLRRTKANAKTASSSSPAVRKLFMEFKASDFCKYQLLQIGGYYIVKHQGEDSCCYLDSGCGSRVKVLINSRTKLWNLSFSSENVPLANDSLNGTPSKEFNYRNSEVFPGDEVRNHTKFPAGYSRATLSDVSLHVSPDIKDTLESDLMETERSLANPASTLEEAITYPSCSGTTTSSLLSGKPLRSSDIFPEGKLISVRGDVISVHSCCSSDWHPGHGSIDDKHHSRNLYGDTDTISIHVAMQNHMVEIFGSLRKHAYPIGFGRGVNATFYRILNFGVQKRFMLTPVSFIAVNSIEATKDEQLMKHTNRFHHASDSTVASCEVPSSLISEFTHQIDVSARRLRCRVIAVLITVLQNNRESVFPQSVFPQLRLESMSPLVNIPIASFLVEDGSSACICWANAEQASTLLRLHEKLGGTSEETRFPMQKRFGGSYDASKSSDYHLDRILRKHDKVTMNNYGSLLDSDQEFVITVGSDKTLHSSEEDLLESIMFNASSGRDWIIVGKLMGSGTIEQLEQQHSLKIDMELDRSVPHMWAIEVCYPDPLMEARRTIKELLAVEG